MPSISETNNPQKRLLAIKIWVGAWTGLCLLGLCFIHALLGEFLHTYRHWLESLGQSPAEIVPNLSLISRSIAFPIVGLQEYSDSSRLWFFLFWSIIYVVPIISGISTLRARSREVIVERLVYIWFPYFAFLLVAVAAIAFGLWAPFHALL